MTRTVRLIPIDPELQAVLEQGAGAFEARYGALAADALDLMRDVVPLNLAMPASPPPSGGYLAVDEPTRAVIGTCGFKPTPAEPGAAEIAYYTFPAFEGRGYATAMASRLVEIAWESGRIETAIAHTLPEPNASTRILGKLGFRFAGEVVDPEDGPVWRWELPRPGGPAGG